ncbi:MAG: hypothetical protein S4CHLAM102_10550 [Chlamydiia bacterium]|nr:hypothetical protein [Chlamydiia bacterium]
MWRAENLVGKKLVGLEAPEHLINVIAHLFTWREDENGLAVLEMEVGFAIEPEELVLGIGDGEEDELSLVGLGGAGECLGH